MMRLPYCVFPVLVLLMFHNPFTAADDRAYNRWAIVASPDVQRSGLTNLLTVELSKIDGIELVEREAIDKVLGELSLSAAGLVNPQKMLKLGKLVSAEAILFIEHKRATTPDAVRVRLIETRTGIRLVDFFVSAGKPEQQIAGLMGRLRDAKQKLRCPLDKRCYVGVLTMQGGQPRADLKPTTRALKALVEHDLGRLPRVVVLEREQLPRLRDERDLTGIELKLRSSTTLIEGAVRGGGKLEISFKLIPLAGGLPKHVATSGTLEDLAALRASMVRVVRSALDTGGGAIVPADSRREATIFAQQAVHQASQGNYAEAASLAEAALVLDDSRASHRYAINVYGKAAQDRDRPIRDRLQSYLRAHQLDLAVIQRYVCVRESGRNELTYWPYRYFAKRADVNSAGAEGYALAEAMRRLNTRKFELLMAHRRQRGVSLEPLSSPYLQYGVSGSSDTKEFAKHMRHIISVMQEELRSPGVESKEGTELGRRFYAHLGMAFYYLHELVPHKPGSGPEWNPLEDPEIRELLQWMTLQENPVVRATAYQQLSQREGEEGVTAGEELVRMILEQNPPKDAVSQVCSQSLDQVGFPNLPKSKRLADYFENLLDRAERTGEASMLVRHPRIISKLLEQGAGSQRQQWRKRLLAMIDQKAYDPDLAGQVARLRADLDKSRTGGKGGKKKDRTRRKPSGAKRKEQPTTTKVSKAPPPANALRWIGDVDFCWTKNLGGNTNWNAGAVSDGRLPTAEDCACFDGTLPTARFPEDDDHLRYRSVEIPTDVTVRRLDFYQVAAGLKDANRFRLGGEGTLTLRGDDRRIGLNVVWQDANVQELRIDNDLEVAGNVRIVRRHCNKTDPENLSQLSPARRRYAFTRAPVWIYGKIGEDAPGREVEFDNEQDSVMHKLVLVRNNTFSGDAVVNGFVTLLDPGGLGQGKQVTLATRRDTTLELALTGANFRVFDRDIVLHGDPAIRRTTTIRGTHIDLRGTISGGDPDDLLVIHTISADRTIRISGQNTYAAGTRIRGHAVLTGTLPNCNLCITGRLTGDDQQPGKLICRVSGNRSDCIQFQDYKGNAGTGCLDTRFLAIEFKVDRPPTKDTYVILDYSNPKTVWIAAGEESTGKTFAKAINVPKGYKLYDNKKLKQVELNRGKGAGNAK